LPPCGSGLLVPVTGSLPVPLYAVLIELLFFLSLTPKYLDKHVLLVTASAGGSGASNEDAAARKRMRLT
jgi:hypothetical protein